MRTFFWTLLVFVGLVGLFSLRSPVLAVSGNLVTSNPGFETTDFTGWTNTSGWTNQTTTKHSGSRAAKCSYTGGGSCTTTLKTIDYDVTPGHSISFGAWVYVSSSSATITVEPSWTLSTGSVYADPAEISENYGSWEFISLSQFVPTNATKLKLKFSISTVVGDYYVDDAEFYDYSPEEQKFQFSDFNDYPSTQVTSEGVDTSSEKVRSDWLEAVGSRKTKIKVRVFRDADEDGKYDPGEFLLSGISVKAEKCANPGKPCNSYGSYLNGTTDSLGSAYFKWNTNVTYGTIIRQTTTPSSGMYCSDSGATCTSKHLMKNDSGTLNQGILTDISGILYKETNTSTCTTQVGVSECYKIVQPDSNFRYLKRDTTAYPTATIFNDNQYKKVVIRGPYLGYNGNYAPKSPRLVKLVTPVTNYTATYGLGGGDIEPTSYGAKWLEMNAKSIHPSAVWYDISVHQPNGSPDDYEFDANSDLVKGMAYCDLQSWSCGINILWGDPPTWAQGSNRYSCEATSVHNLDRSHLQDLKLFAGRLAEEFPQAHHFKFMNEVDAANKNCSVADYAEMFGAVADGIHDVNPNAKVATAGFMLENDPPTNTYSTDWVKAFLGTSAAQKADIINIHSYSTYWGGVADKDSNGTWLHWSDYDAYSGGSSRSKLNWLNKQLVANSLWGKTVILTEVGSATSNDTLQADNLFKTFAQTYSSDLPVTLVLWFKYSSKGGGGLTEWLDYALFNESSSTYRASYAAYKAIANELNNMKFFQTDWSNWPNMQGYIFIDSSGNQKEVLWSSVGTVYKTFNGGSGTVRKIDSAGNVANPSAYLVPITTSPVIIDY